MSDKPIDDNRKYSFRTYGLSTLTAAVMTAFITTFMSSALNLSIPMLESYFEANATTISWAVTGYSMAIAATSVIFGKLADMTNRYKWMICGILLFLVMTILTTFSTNVYIFIALRMLQALGSSMIFATNNAILLSNYPEFMRGKAMGFSTASTYIGLTAGPVVGGQLQNIFGWKSIFFVSAAFAVAALAATATSYRIHRDKLPQGDALSLRSRFDVIGAMLFVTGIPVTLFGLSEMSVRRSAPFIFAAGIVLMIAFVMFEKRQNIRTPIIDISLFANSRTFSFSILATALNYAATFAISYEISLYLQLVKGIDPAKAGLIMIILPAMQAAFSPLMGSLSDRYNPHVLASIGMAITTVMLLLLAFVGINTSIPHVMIILATTGFGFAVFSSPNMNAIMGQVSKKDYGVTNSIIATARTCGHTSGMSLLNIVMGIVLGSASLQSSSPESIVEVMHISFLLFTVIGALGIICSLIRTKK